MIIQDQETIKFFSSMMTIEVLVGNKGKSSMYYIFCCGLSLAVYPSKKEVSRAKGHPLPLED